MGVWWWFSAHSRIPPSNRRPVSTNLDRGGHEDRHHKRINKIYYRLQSTKTSLPTQCGIEPQLLSRASVGVKRMWWWFTASATAHSTFDSATDDRYPRIESNLDRGGHEGTPQTNRQNIYCRAQTSLRKPPPIAAISFRGAHSSAHVSRTPIQSHSTTALWTPTVKGNRIFPPRGVS